MMYFCKTFFKILCIYFCLCWVLGCCFWAFSSCSERGLLIVAVSWLFIVETSFVEEYKGFPGGTMLKNPPASAGDWGSISGLGKSPGPGNGNPLQNSCLRNPIDRGAWWATAHGVAKVQTTDTCTLACVCARTHTHTHTHTQVLGCEGFSSCSKQPPWLWCMGLVAWQHVESSWTRD